MPEDTETLVVEHVPEDLVLQRQQRGMTCNKGKVVPALSIFVALLIAGQAVMVYFLTQQQVKITELDYNAKQLKLQDMIKKLPGSPPSQPQIKKLKMASFNIPLAVKDTDGSSGPSMNDLRKIAETSNKLEDSMRYVLLQGDPLRTYPSFNGSILENLKQLKKSLSDREWMGFDSWMQQWFLLNLVQNSKELETTPPPSSDRVTGAPVMTPCQVKKASSRILPGTFVPQCDGNGEFEAMQCWRSTGYCWCVYRNGTEIPETRARAKLDCRGMTERDEFLMGPWGSAAPDEYEAGITERDEFLMGPWGSAAPAEYEADK
ncbi:HLA class II histocompatibility antigen gamma chain isoform X2 [Ascaphus truei]|uniref:HLA class II histocompatibility antigen gamma chain isoform X2 n=1 Tax=Ascaphus truei TaxID=8439 RepID=UPI003F596ED0